MKRIYVCLICLLLLSCAVLPTAGAAEPRIVWDKAELLKAEEYDALLQEASAAASRVGCELAVVTYRGDGYNDRYLGDDFLRDSGRSSYDDLILLIVTLDRGAYYYDLYLYGDAERKITPDEEDDILDARGVYSALKSGKVYQGASAFLTVASEKYANEVALPNPFVAAIPVAVVIAAVFAFIVCSSIKRSYSTKKRSVDYPLDQFAKLELTEESDVFTGSFITTRIISSGNGGGGGRSGGGRGGGGGHAGGR